MRCVIEAETETLISRHFPVVRPATNELHQEADVTGSTLGNYTILERVGGGGMGQVFKALHRRMDRVVAIKLLPPSMQADPAAIARFEREVRVAAQLEHPNIIAAYDADEVDGTRFLVMHYIDGQDLSAVVKENGPLSSGQAVSYILQAAKGLQFAHSAGIVHRDIKPANLLLDKQGVVRILDMGLARMESPDDVETQAELTNAGSVMGTIDYMAPEQALNASNVDARADIYSLGCSLFYLLTGQPIYAGESLTARLIAHQTQPIPDLGEKCPAIPAELEAIFRKMVAKKVGERYQSMSEVIADLEKVDVSVGVITANVSMTGAVLPNGERTNQADTTPTVTSSTTAVRCWPADGNGPKVRNRDLNHDRRESHEIERSKNLTTDFTDSTDHLADILRVSIRGISAIRGRKTPQFQFFPVRSP